jgi:hypothetical protein
LLKEETMGKMKHGHLAQAFPQPVVTHSDMFSRDFKKIFDKYALKDSL